MKPIICLGMIVKNEEKDLPRLLNSVKRAVDKAIIIDTGSTDNTGKIGMTAPFPVIIKRYTDASHQDESGDWKLDDFSKARNVYLEEAETAGVDWVLSLDADDELTTPDAIRRASYLPQDAFSVWIRDGGVKWLTHRMFRAKAGIRYEGRAHEYPKLDNMKLGQLNDVLLIHHGEAGINQENSNVRNLRILTLEWKEKPSARCAFYLACTHRDGGRWKEAAQWYTTRISMGHHYWEEWVFAHLYLGRALRQLGQLGFAQEALEEGIKAAPDWCEFKMELARMAYDGGNYVETIERSMPCIKARIPPTQLWRETNAYTDQPVRLISWCHEHMGNLSQALAWSELAIELIGEPDQEWAQRHQRLRAQIMGYVA